ncbi:alpha/beta hydrolase family protein [Planobispora takensis]|uniref:Lipase n=1 Tax=Planobispora takensis TaxID=1367882 RepID=A0A8J3WX61_9ACTN|nr:lipase family protein [Planobispora takensis]GII04900.1 hypothetical protein Pta02_69080 [Planobispora takensis]
MSSPPFTDPPENAPAGEAFYTPPPQLPGPPGDPVYQRRLDNPVAELTGGRNWLVLYRSEDAHGAPIAVSGIIVLPHEPPATADGYPLISWAHGTVGAWHMCAPSRDSETSQAHAMNAYPQTLLNHFLDQRWAVAMTDYEGLGVRGNPRHPYMLGKSEANTVLDIVHTARRLFPGQISGRYAIVGHSQGGQAALFSAHHAPERADGLVGVAAIAPANHALDVVRGGAHYPGPNRGYAFTPLFLAGAIGGDPSIRPEEVLSLNARQYWDHVDERCRVGLSWDDSWGRKVTGNYQFKVGYLDDPNDDQEKFNEQLEAMNPDVRITVPVRITQSADDERVRAATTVETVPIIDREVVVRGTDALVEELERTNAGSEPPLSYQFYKKGEIPKPDPDPGELGVHFATINHDLPALTAWLGGLLGA